MGTSEEVKKLTEDPCQKCDSLEKRNTFLEKIYPHLADPNESTDPSPSQQTSEQYQQSQLKYKYLFELAPDAVFIADVESGVILDANESAAKVLGIPVDEIIGMHQSQLHPPQEAEKYKKIFQEHIQKGTAIVLDDICVCRKDGHKIPVQINATVTQMGNKKIVYGIFRDISELNQLLEDCKTSEARFQRLAEATFEGIAIHHQGKAIEVNQQYLNMFGCTLEELTKTPYGQTIAPESMDLVREKVASGYEGIYEILAVKKDGTVFPIEVQAKNAVLNGEPVRIAAFRDLTEQKKLQQQLMDSERKYRELYRKAQIALFRTRLSDGKMLDCSQATSALLGYTDEAEFLNLPSVTETYVDPQQRLAFIEALKKDKRVEGFHTQLKRKDGTHIWVSMSAEIFPEQGFIEGVLLDISVTKTLSDTEKTILDYLMQGMSNKEIAFKTDRSVRTIEDHRAHIMQKLGVDNIVELTQKAFKLTNHHAEK